MYVRGRRVWHGCCKFPGRTRLKSLSWEKCRKYAEIREIILRNVYRITDGKAPSALMRERGSFRGGHACFRPNAHFEKWKSRIRTPELMFLSMNRNMVEKVTLCSSRLRCKVCTLCWRGQKVPLEGKLFSKLKEATTDSNCHWLFSLLFVVLPWTKIVATSLLGKNRRPKADDPFPTARKRILQAICI